MDYNFRCSYCIKLIAQDSPVYMGFDCAYCSTSCRNKGQSSLYRKLRDLQSESAKDLKPRGISTRTRSSSSLSSWRREWNPSGPLQWVLTKIVDVVCAHVAVPPLVHTTSAAILKKIQPAMSFNALLDYMPAASSFLDLRTQASSAKSTSAVGKF